MVYKHIDRIVQTDVLVIGGGGAALAAAISARQQGGKVTLAAKGEVGRSGNSIMIGGGFGMDGQSASEVLGKQGVDATFTKERSFASIVEQSFYLSDQDLVERFIETLPDAFQPFLEWVEEARETVHFIPQASMWSISGRRLGNVLKHALDRNPELEVIEDTIAVDIIVQDGKAVGAVAVDVYSGKLLLIEAGSIIIATGGYQPFSLKSTNSDMNGDGIAMAYRAGAGIADMEFMLFIPTLLEPKSMKGTILPFLMTLPGAFPPIFKVKDGLGHTVAIPEELQGIRTKLNKLVMSWYWGHASVGNGLYYDFSERTDEEIIRAFDQLSQNYASFHKKGTYNKIDLTELLRHVLRERKLKIALGNEYSMGGIEVDANMRTGIEALFAAGEAASGLYGAFRGGDGVSEMLATGVLAGRAAGAYSRERVDEQAERLDPGLVDTITDRLLEPFSLRDGVSPYAVRVTIEQAADSGFHAVRNESGLRTLVDTLARIRKEELDKLSLASTGRTYNPEWLASIAVRNLLDCVEAGARAALLRKESRGTHVRSDHPEVNHEEWLVKIVTKRQGGEMVMHKRKPRTTRIPLPEGQISDIPDFIKSTLAAADRRSERS